MSTGSGSTEPTPADRPYEAGMRATALAAYAAIGVDAPIEVGYSVRSAPRCGTTPGVAEGLGERYGEDFAEGREYYVRRVFDGGREQLPPDAELFDRARRHFLDEGWQVTDYTSPRPELQGFSAVRDGAAVTFEVPQTALVLTSGPCAVSLGVLGGVFTPVP